MNTTEVVALGYRYPTPTAADDLSRAIEADTNPEVQRHMRRFVEAVGSRPRDCCRYIPSVK